VSTSTWTRWASIPMVASDCTEAVMGWGMQPMCRRVHLRARSPAAERTVTESRRKRVDRGTPDEAEHGIQKWTGQRRMLCLLPMKESDVLPAGSSNDLRLAVSAAQAAGAVICERFHAEASTVHRKDGKGEVTETDLAAEAAIFDVLSGSDHGILSEEAGGTHENADLWIIDPVDGTTNFSRRLSLCAVSIGLRLGGQLALGVILHPVTGEVYLAERGLGAWKNQQRLHVATTDDPSLAVIYLTHGYAAEHRRRYGEALARFAETSYPRTFGSTAAELSFVAAGAGDGWICSGDELWDFAAGMVLVEEAGGRVSDWRGADWDGQSTFTIVSNGAIHGFLTDTVSDLQPV